MNSVDNLIGFMLSVLCHILMGAHMCIHKAHAHTHIQQQQQQQRIFMQAVLPTYTHTHTHTHTRTHLHSYITFTSHSLIAHTHTHTHKHTRPHTDLTATRYLCQTHYKDPRHNECHDVVLDCPVGCLLHAKLHHLSASTWPSDTMASSDAPGQPLCVHAPTVMDTSHNWHIYYQFVTNVHKIWAVHIQYH